MTEQQLRWVRIGLIYLAATSLAVGVWATIAPRSFYDGFPGGGRRWIAGDGPYNAHLLSDAGVGFLAVGAVVALAAVWLDQRVTQAALVAVVVHAVPHLLFHLRHPNQLIGLLDATLSNGGLAFAAILGLALLALVSSQPRCGTVGLRERRIDEEVACDK